MAQIQDGSVTTDNQLGVSYPASYMLTNVTLPAVAPTPPAIRNSPANLPSLVIQGTAFAEENSS